MTYQFLTYLKNTNKLSLQKVEQNGKEVQLYASILKTTLASTKVIPLFLAKSSLISESIGFLRFNLVMITNAKNLMVTILKQDSLWRSNIKNT